MSAELIMNYLIQGLEPAEKIEILISETNIRSSDSKLALAAHYVKGVPLEIVTTLYGVDMSNLKRSMKLVNKVAGKYTRCAELDGLVKPPKVCK